MENFTKKINNVEMQTYTEIKINKPIDEVWKIMTDFKNMKNWSSTLQSLKEKDDQLEIVYKIPGTDQETTILKNGAIVKKGYTFFWSGWSAAGKDVIDRHVFRLEKVGDSETLLIQTDNFLGLQDSNGQYFEARKNIHKFFEMFNNELKAESEK